MGFYMLPEDRIREDAVIAGEHAKRTHIKGLRKNKGGHIAVLTQRLRVSIEARAPENVTARAALRREFSKLDTDGSGAVDLKEFTTVVSRYLNGAEPEDLQKMFRSFDQDSNGTVSIEEFTDKLLWEAGGHNFRHKEYVRTKPRQEEDEETMVAPPPSSRPRSNQSQWTARVKRQAGKTLTTVPSAASRSTRGSARSLNRGSARGSARSSARGSEHGSAVRGHGLLSSDAGRNSRASSSRRRRVDRKDNNNNNNNKMNGTTTESMNGDSRPLSDITEEESIASSSNLGSRAHSLRWAHRHTDHHKGTVGEPPLTRNAVEQHMATLMIEEATVQFLGQFRRAVRRSSGQERRGKKMDSGGGGGGVVLDFDTSPLLRIIAVLINLMLPYTPLNPIQLRRLRTVIL